MISGFLLLSGVTASSRCCVDSSTTALRRLGTYDTIVAPSAEKPNTLDFTSVSRRQHVPWNLLAISSDCPHQRQVALDQLLGQLIAGKQVVGDDVPARSADAFRQLQHHPTNEQVRGCRVQCNADNDDSKTYADSDRMYAVGGEDGGP